MSAFQTFAKSLPVQAKLFQPGDEDGIDVFDSATGEVRPFINTLENQKFFGLHGAHYLCVGAIGERWLVEKDIFERTYKLIEDTTAIGESRIRSEDVIIDQARQICCLRREVRALEDEVDELIDIINGEEVPTTEKTSLCTSHIF